jgi:uncharacterized protein YndB with AHSA1/START domain
MNASHSPKGITATAINIHSPMHVPLRVRFITAGADARHVSLSQQRNMTALLATVWLHIADDAGIDPSVKGESPMADRIEKTVDIASPVERVWQALTDYKEFGAWFRVRLDNPFVPGEITRGRITYPGYEHLPWQAKVLIMDRPRTFVFEWPPYAVDPDTDYSREPWTRVEFRLEAIPDGTRVTVTESGFDALPPGRAAEALRMNEGGWEEQVRNIKAYVES